VSPFQDHLVPAVQAGDFVEKDNPALQEVRAAIILMKENKEKLSPSARAQAYVTRWSQVYFPARAVTGRAISRYQRKATVIAPEYLALSGSECLWHGFF
jgi:hypothetical protein